MKKYKSKYTDKYDDIDRMLLSNIKVSKISEELQVPLGIVRYRIKVLGIQIEHNTTFAKYGSRIQELWEKGKTTKEISDELGLTKHQVRGVVRSHNFGKREKYETLEKRIEKLRNELLSYGYEYISGYQKYNSLIRIKDLSNGIEYNVNCHNFIQRKRNNKISEHYEPTRDRKITLRGLYKNFNGICYICGEKCDFSDWHINENGTRCFGGNYPSIEHLIPRSRGGKTEWKNVLLAHRKCNSSKNTKTVEEANIEVNI